MSERDSICVEEEKLQPSCVTMVGTRQAIYGVGMGATFGSRKVLGFPFSDGHRHWMVVVRCRCGLVSTVECRKLSRGLSVRCQSCQISDQKKTHGDSVGTRLYYIWLGMKQRCGNPSCQNYKNYGGRGISVCQEWIESYEAFKEWALANGYADNLEIDRRNNDGNYEPGNCRWITRLQNGRNRRTNRMIYVFGESKCMADWADDDRCVVSLSTLSSRLSNGWTPERAITKPARLKVNRQGPSQATGAIPCPTMN